MPTTVVDHAVMMVEMELGRIQGTSIWRFNNSLLRDNIFKDKIIRYFKKSLQEKHEENKNKEVHEELKEERKALDKMATAEIEKNIMYTRQKYFIKIF